MRRIIAERMRSDIEAKYKSIRAFALAHDIDYTRLINVINRGIATDYYVQLVYKRLGGGFDIYAKMFEVVNNHDHKTLGISRRAWYYIKADKKIPHKYWEKLYEFSKNHG